MTRPDLLLLDLFCHSSCFKLAIMRILSSSNTFRPVFFSIRFGTNLITQDYNIASFFLVYASGYHRYYI